MELCALFQIDENTHVYILCVCVCVCVPRARIIVACFKCIFAFFLLSWGTPLIAKTFLFSSVGVWLFFTVRSFIGAIGLFLLGNFSVDN